MSFPKEFLWGVATSAYQIEGAAGEGGKGASVWDRFSKVPGRIADGSTGERACAHFHLFREDVALMADLGIPCYRFSLSWPRLLPDGRGRLSPDGAAFYDRLIDALLEKGIRPFVTLFHWDYPCALAVRGGWASPDSPEWFADYAAPVSYTHLDVYKRQAQVRTLLKKYGAAQLSAVRAEDYADLLLEAQAIVNGVAAGG